MGNHPASRALADCQAERRFSRFREAEAQALQTHWQEEHPCVQVDNSKWKVFGPGLC